MLNLHNVSTYPAFVRAMQPLEFYEPPEDYFGNEGKRQFTEWVALDLNYQYQGETIDGKPDGRGILIEKNKGMRIGYSRNGTVHGKGFAILIDGTTEIGECKFGIVHGSVVKKHLNKTVSTKQFFYGQLVSEIQH